MPRTWPRLDLHACCQAVSTCAGLGASFLVARGSFAVTADAIARLAGTYFDQNPYAVQALAAQAAEGQAGAGLLVVSVVAGLPALWSDRNPAIGQRNRSLGLLVGFLVGCALTAVAWAWADNKAAALVAAIGG